MKKVGWFEIVLAWYLKNFIDFIGVALVNKII